MKYNILIVYDYAPVGPMRAAIRDHLYSFKKNSQHHVYYLNLAYREKIPGHIKKIKYDLIIFHTIFFSARWDEAGYERTRKKAQFLKELDAIKIGLPQDEHFKTDYICDMINEFDIGIIFTVSPESEWDKFYKGKIKDSVKFHRVLTGYLEDKTVEKIQRLAKSNVEKPIDIGYRAWRADPCLGRHGILKPRIAELFQDAGSNKAINLDISTRLEDTILGDDWFKFLLKCKYTIGVEGGASVIDRDGSINKKTHEFVRSHPQASFEEIEAACFPGQDGYLNYYALSPRHLEACATKTCQVLIEGDYNGILKPNEHYIELKRDFSNLNEVMEMVLRDELRTEIVERAFTEIVESQRYSYDAFVADVINRSFSGVQVYSERSLGWLSRVTCRWNWILERIHPRRINTVRKYRSYRSRVTRTLKQKKR